jgi:RimJ/RimL family protein N-acetyltransferase
MDGYADMGGVSIHRRRPRGCAASTLKAGMRFYIRPAGFDGLDRLSSLVWRANTTYRPWAGAEWRPPGEADERRRWRDRLEDRRAWNAVATAGGELLGCASFTRARSEVESGGTIRGRAHVSRLFVAPEHWGNGIGGELLRAAVDEICRRGYGTAQFFTPRANSRARRFYEHNGWVLRQGTRRWHGLLLVRYGREGLESADA